MNEATYVYIVHSDINENNIYAEFATEEEAIDYARRHKDELTYVDKAEVALDEDGEIIEMFDNETVWIYDEEDEFKLEEEVNEFDLDFDDERPLIDTRKRTNPWAKPLDYISKEDLYRLDVFIKKVRKNGTNKLTKDSVIKFGNKRVLTAGLADCNSLEDVENKLEPYFDYLPSSIYNRDIEAYDEIVSVLPKILWELKTGISVDDEGLDESFLEDEIPLSEGIKLRTREEQDEFFRLCDEIGIITGRDIERFKREVGCTDENILQALRDYRAELGPDFKIANPELERELAKKYEGIDFDSLVEELEEHEDMVECKECYNLVAKESCHKNEVGKYVCEKCHKSLTESISELTPEQLAEMDAYLRSGKDLHLEDYEEEYSDFSVDIVSGELTYNSEANDFTFYLSIYHASEDNNAEYPEYHTDEEEYSFSSLEEIYDEFPQYLIDIYKFSHHELSKVEETLTEETVESDQELEGTDNVVVKCKEYDIVSHSEDEKPVDCKGEKKPLEKSLTESSLVKGNYEISPTEHLSWGWEKGEGYYVEKAYRNSEKEQLWNTDFRRAYATAEDAEKAFKRYVKKYSILTEDALDWELEKVEIKEDSLEETDTDVKGECTVHGKLETFNNTKEHTEDDARFDYDKKEDEAEVKGLSSDFTDSDVDKIERIVARDVRLNLKKNTK